MSNLPNFDHKAKLEELLKMADTFGADHGKGPDAQIKFLIAVVDSAYFGTVDMTKNKHGEDVDDAHMLTERYFKARGGATLYDAKAGNNRKAASMTRTCIKLGGLTGLGDGEPVATVNELMAIRKNLRKDPANAKLMVDAANGLMSYARLQMKREEPLTSEELRSIWFKAPKEGRSVEDIVVSLRKATQQLYNGTGPHGLRLDTPEMKRASDAFNAVIKKMTAEKTEPKDDDEGVDTADNTPVRAKAPAKARGKKKQEGTTEGAPPTVPAEDAASEDQPIETGLGL